MAIVKHGKRSYSQSACMGFSAERGYLHRAKGRPNAISRDALFYSPLTYLGLQIGAGTRLLHPPFIPSRAAVGATAQYPGKLAWHEHVLGVVRCDGCSPRVRLLPDAIGHIISRSLVDEQVAIQIL